MTAVLTVNNVAAQTVYDTAFQTIGSVELVELTEDNKGNLKEIPVMKQNLLKSKGQNAAKPEVKTEEKTESQELPLSEFDDVIMKTEKMIALGEKLYAIVKKGEPVVSLDSTPVSVLPVDEKGGFFQAFDLESWKAPKTQKYRVVFKNLYGISTVSFEFMLIFSYGGSLNGKGSYITAAQIKPTYLNVLWGYTFDANFHVQSITNQGSKDSPVAAAVLMMDFRVKTVLQETISNKTFHVNGLGQVTSF